jgi:porin
VFGRAGFVPEHDQSMVALYADGGINWFAPFPGREGDVAGVAISHTHFGEDFRQTCGEGIAHSETTLELTYLAKITRWMHLQGDLQFLFNPQASSSPAGRETATLLGVRAEVRF